MALPNVDINQTNGNSGRAAEGFDYYSGLMFYGTAPSVTGKWNTYPGPPIIKAQQLFSSDDATSAGIIPYTDNTASTMTYVITTKGNTADTIELKCTLPQPNGRTTLVDGITSNTISLGVYTVAVADSTIALQGAAWAAVINAGTLTHGFTASFTTATLTVTAPKSAGISLNTGTPYSVTISATFVGTTTQNVVTGTLSNYAVWKYHIDEYFRVYGVNNGGNIWVGIISASSSFNEVPVLEVASGNKVRQIGIFDNNVTRGLYSNISGSITQLDVATKTLQKTTPFISIYSPNIAAASVDVLATFPDQNLNTASRVQCVLSQDGDNNGALLFVVSGITIGNVGAKLASIAKSRVSASDAQPIELFNMSDGAENNVPAFGNGVLSANVTNSLQVQLDSYRYTFFRQFGFVGTYWSGNKTCVASTSDYCNVNDNRVSDKVIRICYDTYTPLLNSELLFNSDGTLRTFTVETFKDAGTDAITADMITGFGDMPLISGVLVDINPTQKVKTTENLIVNVTLNENGIARKITVNIGYGLA